MSNPENADANTTEPPRKLPRNSEHHEHQTVNMLPKRLAKRDGDWRIRRGILKFFNRPELERYQLEINNRLLRGKIEYTMERTGVLRYIHSVETHYVEDRQMVNRVDIHLTEHGWTNGGPGAADYSRVFASLSQDDIEDLLRRLSSAYIDYFSLSYVAASNSANSLEQLLAQRQINCRIGTADVLSPDAGDDFDYAIMDFIGAVVQPNLIRFDDGNALGAHAATAEALALLERESFRGRHFEISVYTEMMPTPERLLAPTLLARTCDFRAWDSPSMWVDAFIHCFERATSLGSELQELTIHWDARDGDALAAERLQTPENEDVPMPRHDFVFTRKSPYCVVACTRSKCALYQFVNPVLNKRLEVYGWTTESDFTFHALLFKIVTP